MANLFYLLSMTNRFSIDGAPLISNIGPVRASLATPYAAGQTVVRRSRVLGVSPAPIQTTFQSHVPHVLPHAGLTTSTVVPAAGFHTSTFHPPSVAVPGLRKSVVISPNEIPPGATIIRVDRPAEVHTHEPQVIHQTKKVTAEATPMYAQRRSSGCPWWVWALLGLLGLLLLAGLLFGLLSAFGRNKQEYEVVEPIVQPTVEPTVAGEDENKREEKKEEEKKEEVKKD